MTACCCGSSMPVSLELLTILILSFMSFINILSDIQIINIDDSISYTHKMI